MDAPAFAAQQGGLDNCPRGEQHTARLEVIEPLAIADTVLICDANLPERAVLHGVQLSKRLFQFFAAADHGQAAACDMLNFCFERTGLRAAAAKRMEQLRFNCGERIAGCGGQAGFARVGAGAAACTRALDKHFRCRSGNTVGAEHPAGAFTGRIESAHGGFHIGVYVDTAFKIMRRRRDRQSAARLKNFHNVRIDARFQRRQVCVQLLKDFLWIQVKIKVNTAGARAFFSVDFTLNGVGQKHLVPFAVQGQTLHLFGEIFLCKGFSVLVSQIAIACRKEDIRQDIAAVHRWVQRNRRAEGHHFHVNQLRAGAQCSGLSFAAQVGRTAVYRENIVRAARRKDDRFCW